MATVPTAETGMVTMLLPCGAGVVPARATDGTTEATGATDAARICCVVDC